MATLLASLRAPDLLCTIGSPRVGDQAFVQTLAGINVSRYVDCSDLVTRIPPEEVPGIGRYAHAGKVFYIAKDGSVRQDPDDDFVQDDRLKAAAEYIVEYGWKTGNVAVRELADHTPINYVEPLNAGA
jgi:Lipase (class 3)